MDGEKWRRHPLCGPSDLQSDAEVGWQRQRHGGGCPPFEFELASCDLSPGRSRQRRIAWLTHVARLAQTGPPVVGVYPGPSACRPRGDKDRRHAKAPPYTSDAWPVVAWCRGRQHSDASFLHRAAGMRIPDTTCTATPATASIHAVQVRYSVDGRAVPKPRQRRESWWCVSHGGPKPPLR